MQGINDLAVQPDGKIVAVGGNVVARYNSDGTLDATFGTGGEVVVPFNDDSDVLNRSSPTARYWWAALPRTARKQGRG